MILTSQHGVLVQGITGKQGRFWAECMAECGTRIVAGVSPGKGGLDVSGVPVYKSVSDACSTHKIDVTVLFVPPLAAKDAALEAVHAGVATIVVLTEHVPRQDVMEVLAAARDRNVRVVGPNTAGLVTPGAASVGIMPGHAPNIFRPGTVGIISRSGSLGTLVAYQIVQAGYGQSSFIGIGGDPILGTTTADALRALEAHEVTSSVVVVGEVGGTMEEDAAAVVADMTKPVIAFIAGRTAPPGKRMGHAGALVDGDKGTAGSKARALRSAGAHVLDLPTQVGDALRSLGERVLEREA